jgi:hypothetical protein
MELRCTGQWCHDSGKISPKHMISQKYYNIESKITDDETITFMKCSGFGLGKQQQHQQQQQRAM